MTSFDPAEIAAPMCLYTPNDSVDRIDDSFIHYFGIPIITYVSPNTSVINRTSEKEDFAEPDPGRTAPRTPATPNKAERTFRCYVHEECKGRIFSTRGNYTRHIKEKVGQGQCACEMCGKTFSRKSNRDKHVKAMICPGKWPGKAKKSTSRERKMKSMGPRSPGAVIDNREPKHVPSDTMS